MFLSVNGVFAVGPEGLTQQNVYRLWLQLLVTWKSLGGSTNQLQQQKPRAIHSQFFQQQKSRSYRNGTDISYRHEE